MVDNGVSVGVAVKGFHVGVGVDVSMAVTVGTCVVDGSIVGRRSGVAVGPAGVPPGADVGVLVDGTRGVAVAVGTSPQLIVRSLTFGTTWLPPGSWKPLPLVDATSSPSGRSLTSVLEGPDEQLKDRSTRLPVCELVGLDEFTPVRQP